MVHFPVRKCYHAIKITLLLILVLAVLALFEQWRGGKRGSSAFMDPAESEFERQILEDEARIVPGLGEGGVAAYLTGEDLKRGEESEKQLAMNVYLSDRIAYNRTLKDHRNPACDRVVYDAELPSASVILIFHNEPYSVVVRTVWSVINSCRRDNPWYRRANFVDNKGRTMKLGYPGQDPSSPLVYLKEIILVDDNSTLPELKGKLSHYVRTRLPPDLIRILRLPDRVGLTRARLAGARYAAGDALVFLDAHCEGQPDWLRPQLQALKRDPHAVVVPIIDVVDASNFYYSVQDSTTFQVGGFTFTGHFTWIDVPEREKKRRGSDISPTWSPTMAGGLFAINRAYYWELGAYDEQMAGWGGENLEMSFRIWQCGGTLETIPCSRVGHVFRSFHPYGLPAHTDTHGINTARMAEVWMDEYAELFYLHRPDLRNNPKIGDVTHRKVLREKLQCKSFQWYLDNIYREKFVPVRDAYGYGRFQNPSTGLCLDTLQREAEEAPLGVYQCHASLQATQYLMLSLSHELRTEDDCAHAMYRSYSDYIAMKRARKHKYLKRNSVESDDSSRKVLMSGCRGRQREQKWVYIPGSRQLQHSETGLCLDAGAEPGADVLLRPCSAAATQVWLMDYSEDNDFRISQDVVPNDQQKKLHQLRGQRRKSRSLLSYATSNFLPNATIRRHHKKHKKRSKKNKKTKNKFILRLVRTHTNNSEEHLEVDIHCNHRQLYPNNTFVRDLVTILNDKDIKVINNGRVFERNRVTQLDPRGGEGGARDGEGAGGARVLTKMDVAEQQAPPDTLEPKISKKARKLQLAAMPALQPQPAAAATHAPHAARTAPHAARTAPHAARTAPHAARTAPHAARTAPHAARTAPRAHRIIIEDFVELAPSNTQHPKRLKKRQRKRPAPSRGEGAGLASLLERTPPIDEQTNMVSASKESAEEAPAAPRGGALQRPALRPALPAASEEEDDQPMMFLDAFRSARRNSSAPLWRRQRQRTAEDTDEPEEQPTAEGAAEGAAAAGAAEGAAEGPAPVKVVMRSNLTFNLGDEFFRRRRARDPPSLPPTTLAILAPRAAPPALPWRRAGDETAPPDSDDDSSTSDSGSSSSDK